MKGESSLDAGKLLARIEAFAPRKYRKERERLFADLRRALGGEDEPFVFLLVGITWVHRRIVEAPPPSRRVAQRGGRRARSRARRVRGLGPLDHHTYTAQLQKLKRNLERISTDPLIRRFPLYDVEFYARQEVICPHARYRKTCEHVRETLERLRQESLILKYQPGRRAGMLRELKQAGVDPRTHKADDYCAPAPPRDDDALGASSAAGRPADPRRRGVLEAFLPFLKARGVPLPTVLDFLAKILRYCFDDPVRPATLRRQWERTRTAALGPVELPLDLSPRGRVLNKAEKSSTVRRALQHNARVAEAEARRAQDPDQHD